MDPGSTQHSDKKAGPKKMKPPTIYPEWVKCLDAIKEGGNDKEVFECMTCGTLELSAGVSDRFAKKLSETIQFRMKKQQDKFTRSVQTGGGEHALVNAIVLLRKEFLFLIEIAMMPVLPKEHSDSLVSAIRGSADKVQENLEHQAKSDRVGFIASVIRNNRVNNLG
jgi:hypothetical protein